MNATKFDGLLFDLDGTLWDAAGTCAKAWNESLRQLGYQQVIEVDAVRAASGLQIETIFRQRFGFIPEERHGELLTCYRQKQADFLQQFGGELYPQVREVLLALKKQYPLFVVSNCLSGYIEHFIGFHRLEGIFNDTECSGRTGRPKTENIKLIAERNGLKAPVYIGDTVWDQEAAQAAAVPFIYAAYGFGKVEGAAEKIDRFSDLLRLL